MTTDKRKIIMQQTKISKRRTVIHGIHFFVYQFENNYKQQH